MPLGVWILVPHVLYREDNRVLRLRRCVQEIFSVGCETAAARGTRGEANVTFPAQCALPPVGIHMLIRTVCMERRDGGRGK
jgi:hypothetical protein